MLPFTLSLALFHDLLLLCIEYSAHLLLGSVDGGCCCARRCHCGADSDVTYLVTVQKVALNTLGTYSCTDLFITHPNIFWPVAQALLRAPRTTSVP